VLSLVSPACNTGMIRLVELYQHYHVRHNCRHELKHRNIVSLRALEGDVYSHMLQQRSVTSCV
jgi:hypothetical protein